MQGLQGLPEKFSNQFILFKTNKGMKKSTQHPNKNTNESANNCKSTGIFLINPSFSAGVKK